MSERPHAYLQRFSGLSPRASAEGFHHFRHRPVVRRIMLAT
jgi:hypothetical protein